MSLSLTHSMLKQEVKLEVPLEIYLDILPCFTKINKLGFRLKDLLEIFILRLD